MTDWPLAYRCADLTGLARGHMTLRPIHWEDREPIRDWRNAQLEVLRQADPLSEVDQERYYRLVVRPQFDEVAPDQVLMAMLNDGRLVGYGGLVHISWPNRRAEISFMTEPQRLDDATFRSDWAVFLDLMVEVGRERLGLHRLSTETYEIRTAVLETLEACGFVEEGRLRDQVWLEDRYIDSVLHGILLD